MGGSGILLFDNRLPKLDKAMKKSTIDSLKLDWMFWDKMYRSKAELSYVVFDPKKRTFVHVDGKKKGRALSLPELEEMSRRSNLHNELQWALYKLDDKPFHSWNRFLKIAMRNKDRSSIVACLIFCEISLTPQDAVGLLGKKLRDELVKSLQQKMSLKYYGREYHPYISAAIKELKAIKFNRHGKIKERN